MADTAALLADEVLSERPLRPWVLSLPHALRCLLAANPATLTQVLGVEALASPRVVEPTLRPCGTPSSDCARRTRHVVSTTQVPAELHCACRRQAGQGTYGCNAATGTYGDMLEMRILDPTKVTRLAPHNAYSVAGLLLTTEVMVAEPRRPTPKSIGTPEMGAMGHGM